MHRPDHGLQTSVVNPLIRLAFRLGLPDRDAEVAQFAVGRDELGDQPAAPVGGHEARRGLVLLVDE